MHDTQELLARLIQCEASGEGTVGMQAVATVVMNRANAATGRICESRSRWQRPEYHSSERPVHLRQRSR